MSHSFTQNPSIKLHARKRTAWKMRISPTQRKRTTKIIDQTSNLFVVKASMFRPWAVCTKTSCLGIAFYCITTVFCFYKAKPEFMLFQGWTGEVLSFGQLQVQPDRVFRLLSGLLSWNQPVHPKACDGETIPRVWQVKTHKNISWPQTIPEESFYDIRGPVFLLGPSSSCDNFSFRTVHWNAFARTNSASSSPPKKQQMVWTRLKGRKNDHQNSSFWRLPCRLFPENV